MKKEVANNPLTLSALLLALLLLVSKSEAQGFLQNYAVQANDEFTWLDITSGGYCISGAISLTWPDSNVVFFQLGTDADGVETSYTQDTFALVGYNRVAALDCGQFAVATWPDIFNSKIYILSKLDAQGTLFWRDTIPEGFPDVSLIRDLCRTADGNIMLISQNPLLIQKVNADGQVLFSALYPEPIPGITTAYFERITPTPDGGALTNGSIGPSDLSYVIKIAPDCTIEWVAPVPPAAGAIVGIRIAPDGNYLAMATSTSGTIKSTLLNYTPAGALLWQTSLPAVLGELQYQYPMSLVLATNDNGALVSGTYSEAGTPQRSIIARFDADGNLLWKRIYTHQKRFWISSGKALADGNFVFAGTQGNLLMLLKMDADGRIFPNSVSGTVVEDANNDCVADSTEMPLAGWIVTANALGVDHYAVTDSNGVFWIDLPGGPSYFIDLDVHPPSYAWLPCPPLSLVMPADTSGCTLEAEVAARKLLDCPVMTVDIGLPLMRRCADQAFSVQYCNSGTLLAEDAAIEVYLPNEIEMQGSASPYTQTGQTLRFELGNVAAGQCGLIHFTGYVSCDSVQLGQALCVEAHVFPDSFCSNLNGWSGASIEVDGFCLGDTVQFKIQNIGTAPTTQPLGYLVIDDDVVMRRGTLAPGLPVGSIEDVFVPATGTTLRIVVEQEPNHPVPESPSMAVAGCGGWTAGFVTQFPNLTGNPFSDVECRTVIGSYDPNEKQGHPQGVYNGHFVEPGTLLTYVLHFQNTGTDTAFQVVLRDTLSSWLDPATVRPGASSHPYQWALSGSGHLKFTFDPIALPDSNANQEASHGFVQFAVQMRPAVPLGSIIENRAGIYFDQNSVVLTNTVFHQVDTDFLEIQIVSTNEKHTMLPINIHPNPAAEMVFIALNNDFSGEKSLVLTNALGKTVLQNTFSSDKTELRRGKLAPGIYFAKIIVNERIVAVGKVVWK